MVEKSRGVKALRAGVLGMLALTGLAACTEGGGLGLLGGDEVAETTGPVPANAPNQRFSAETDVERPDLFEATDRALWDGRPSLGGVWVAHPDVQDPERVLIRNTENGETTIGALFRRERDNPGPTIQMSSDAAEALGALAGSPVQLSVVALRREEVEVAPPQDNPVIASLDAPVNVEEAALDPAPAASDASASSGLATAADAATETAGVAAETSVAAASLAAIAAGGVTDESTDTGTGDDAPSAPEDTAAVDVSAVFAAPVAPADGARAQIGVYSNEENANADAARIQEAGISAEVLTETMGGQPVWRLVAGPLESEAAIGTLGSLGFVDAFILEQTE